MATRSSVIIRVKPEDIGKTIKFDRKKLPVPLSSWNTEKVRSKCKPVTLEKNYVGVYCHWDGYPGGVGCSLLSKFNDYDTILNLIAGGSCSYISKTDVLHYANRSGEEWKFISPRQIDSIETCGGGTEYAYIFEDGVWKVGIVKYGKYADGETNYNDEYVADIVCLDDEVIEKGHPSERD